MKKDNRLIAILSVFGILLVVLGHSGFEEEIIKQTYAGLHRWIYSFHMPLFFLISGYLFAYTTSDFSKLDVGRLLKKKLDVYYSHILFLGVFYSSLKCFFRNFRMLIEISPLCRIAQCSLYRKPPIAQWAIYGFYRHYF